MKYYFPVRGERYVPSKAHALVEIIECIIHDTKLAVFATYDEASEAGRQILFDDDTFVVFCLDNDCGQLQLYEVYWKNPDQRHGDYIWVCNEILKYIHYERDVRKMFNVKLDNCGGEVGKIKIEVVLKASETQLAFIVNKAREAFRQIEITNNETGELIFSNYTSSDWFSPLSTEGEALDEIQQILEDME